MIPVFEFNFENGKVVSNGKIEWRSRHFVRTEGEYLVLNNCCNISKFYVSREMPERKIMFTVCNDSKLEVERALQIIPNFRMSLWQEWYDDVCLPGKKELLHMNTGMRSVSYTLFDNIMTMPFNIHTDILEWLNKAVNVKEPLTIRYMLTAYTDMLGTILWHERKKQHKLTSFIPMDPVDLNDNEFTELHPVRYSITEDSIIDVKKLGFSNPFLVFSKTHDFEFFIVDGELNAMLMLGYLKFMSKGLIVRCGLNVFEDYYYMPLCYNRIEILNDDSETVLCFNGLNEDYVKLNETLKSCLDLK